VTVLNTAPVDVSGAQTELVRTVAINRPPGVTVVRDAAATVRVTVLPLQGQQVREVPVSVLNVPEGLVGTFTPAVVSVSISGPQPALSRLGPLDVVVAIDVAGRGAGTHSLPAQVSVPEGLRADRVLPDQVTLTLAAP
jgi:YbbR domain-containing protein